MKDVWVISIAIFLLIYSFAITGRYFYTRGYQDGLERKQPLYSAGSGKQ